MKYFTKLTILALLLSSMFIYSQSSFEYELSLVPVSVPNLPGLHSYSYAQHNGKWLIIGGRKDGLHPRQPFSSFPAAQSNTDIYVVDVSQSKFWSASVDELPVNLKEQLQSTNMNFHQEQDTLYIIGGYGFSQTANDHKTYPFLTTIIVSDLINAIENNKPISTFFKQIQDTAFAVTGGHLKKLKDLFYLVGGHRFDGRYNPMGNPTYTQSYTNQIRKFAIDNSENQLSIKNYSVITDPIHLRRRDYNLLPQIFPNGEEGFTISSGVFQLDTDLPFLYPVDITESGYTPITTFNQYLSNYHSAVACLYDSKNKNMHSIFFGGMSQYYYQNGSLIQDNQVPFVKTISRLTRDSNGNIHEFQMPIEMPALHGASAEFILNTEIPHFDSEIIKLSSIKQEYFKIGHILGGISSSQLNPFFNNQTSQTIANKTIYEVWLREKPLSIDENAIDGAHSFDINVHPIPFKDEVFVSFNLEKETSVSIYITNTLGKLLYSNKNHTLTNGEHSQRIDLRNIQEQALFITVVFDGKYYVTKKIIKGK